MDDLIPRGREWDFKDVDFLYSHNSMEYVKPQFERSETANSCRYLVVGAPGAVGKSAFAQHLANAKQAMVWNLASLRLGSNTFIGSIVKAVGAKALSDFLGSIESGETVLVFDALDEAELHSGWAGVESLLREVVEHTPNGRPCSVIFLARRDTAELIEMSLDEIMAGAPLVASGRIGFFDRSAAIEFVIAQIRRVRGSDLVSRQEVVLREKALEAISMGVGSPLRRDSGAQWADDDEERFFGYAPVLQTLAAAIAQIDNPQKVSFDNSPSEHSAIIAKIIETIIDREAQKFSGALDKRDIQDRAALNERNLYSSEDQLFRVLQYVTGNTVAACAPPSGLGSSDAVALEDMFRSFIPQHPFLDGRRFAGPAFRDYLIAWGLLNKSGRHEVEALVDGQQLLFTQILAGIYFLLGSGEANARDVELLYESASSGAPKGESGLYLFVNEADGTLAIEIVGGMTSAQAPMIFTSSVPEELSFRFRLNNAHVLLPGSRVRLGRSEMEFEISGSEVLAKQINVDAGLLRARSTDGRVSRLQAANAEWSPALRIEADKKALEVCWPQSKSFPWHEYSAEFSLEEVDLGAQELIHAVRRILTWFRKDRREDYGRYADLIRNIVVGQSATGNMALDFLLRVGAVYEKGNLYLLEPRVLKELGLSWSVNRGDAPSEAALEAAKKYLKDRNSA